MQISTRFTIAVHMLVCIDTFKETKITSEFLASSINVNAVIIRRLLVQLKNAGIVDVLRGSGGAQLSRPSSDITLYDVYDAVECVGKGGLFHFHENPNPLCPVGGNIHAVLDDRLDKVQNAMENEMKKITLAEISCDAENIISKKQ